MIPKIPGLKLDYPDPRDHREREISSEPRRPVEDLLDEYGEDYVSSDLKGDYQNSFPSCVLHSWSFLYRVQYYQDNERDVDLSERMGYTMAERLEPGESDPGTYSRLGGKVLHKFGICEDKYHPVDVDNFDDYVDYTRISQEALDNAREHKIDGYARVDGLGWGGVSLNGILSGIAKYGAVQLSLRGSRDDWSQDDGIIHPPKGDDVFYHGVAADGWKMIGDELYIKGKNWWDKDKENQLEDGRGRFLFSENYLEHIRGAFVITGLYNPEPVEGWAASEYLEEVNKFEGGDKVITNVNLNIRKTPSIVRNNIVARLKKGGRATIVAHPDNSRKSDNYHWYKVKIDKKNLIS